MTLGEVVDLQTMVQEEDDDEDGLARSTRYDYYTARLMYGLREDHGGAAVLGNSKHGSAFR